MKIDFKEAVQQLKAGKIVAIPTDTVYGIAASISFPCALEKLYLLKKRPRGNPLNLLICSEEQARSVGRQLPPGYEALARNYWPGALTLVIPANCDGVPEIIRAGSDRIGIRMPDHPLLLRLIEETGPLAAPSANLSGTPSGTRKEHIEYDFGNDFPILEDTVLEQQLLSSGIESTVLIFQKNKWRLSRQGAISCQKIESILGYPIEPMEQPPGADFPHYKPRTKIVAGSIYPGIPSVVVGFREKVYPKAKKVYFLGSLDKPEEAASNFYSVLRDMDRDHVDEAWFDTDFPCTGIYKVIRQRIDEICVY